MAEKIKDIKLIRRGDRQFVLSGYCDRENGTIFVVRFYEGDIAKAQTVAKVLDGQMYSLQDIELERGLYAVGLQECIDLRSKQLRPEERLPIKIMAGDAYPVDISCEETVMYGHQGVMVTVSSNEKSLGDHEIFYRVLKAGNLYKQIRYWIPMGERIEFSFFVSEVGSGELCFEGSLASVYSIRVHG